ncbi:uncharacterized protein LOC102806393 [Saccoglossus kowalevskii]|uniref:WD repeat-containing protein 88-like n=1 Tax=Saccoglossus kowalevskii TaxID=10224 RepID=A0ABM0M2B4_SACKO|nr:PREDICTED: WD repeat-containing protein 88-like [Saccoglossus kowalevskii]
MWDISTGMFRSEGPVTLNKGHEGSISSCQFSQDGSLLVSGSYDQTAAVWDADSCILKLSLKGHMDWVCGVDISADMKWILSGSRDKTVRLWNIEDSDNIPLVMENKRSMGLKIVKCGTCGKPFSISQLEDPSEFKVCVFCRLHKGRPLSHMTSIATDEDVPEM